MSLRHEVVEQMLHEETNISALCRAYGVSRKTAYKWLQRYRQGGEAALGDGSRRPQRSPQRCPAEVEAIVGRVREAHPAWGARKIHAFLQRQGQEPLPSPSTLNRILHRGGWIDREEAQKHRPFQRFQREKPNELWQMDSKSPLRLADGTVCYPLTVLDDHLRFLLALEACPNQQAETVQRVLTAVFRRYGLPEAILMDNGAPWGDYQACGTGGGVTHVAAQLLPMSRHCTQPAQEVGGSAGDLGQARHGVGGVVAQVRGPAAGQVRVLPGEGGAGALQFDERG